MGKEIRVADYIADFIVEKGVTDFFVLPGGGAMHLVDGLGNHPDLNFVACHHEQSAAIAAEAYGRITENFGVALVTTGPGATNAITGVVGAWIESVPMMVFSGQVKRSDRIASRPIRQGGVQEVEIVPMIKNHTKYAVTVESPEDIKWHMEKAYYEMMRGRKGPVWIDVPLDVQGAMIDPDRLKGFEDPEHETIDITAELDSLVQMLAISNRPLIFAGHGIRLAGAADKFRILVEHMNIPVVSTWNAIDLIDSESDLFVGKPGVVAMRAGNFAVQNCDLLIGLGTRLDNVLTAYNPKRFALNAKRVMVDVDLAEITNHPIEFDLGIVSDAAFFIDKLLKRVEEIRQKDYSEWIEKCRKWKETYTVSMEFDFSKHEEISHFQFADILSRKLKGGEIVSTGSSGLGIEAFYVAFNVKKGQRVFLTSGLGAMGYGLPAAIGASIANKKRPIIAVESDGSLQLNIQELAILKGQNLPICLFIMDNSGYASIRNTQRNYFEGRYVATGEEGNLHLPDLEKIFMAYGIEVQTVRTASELERAVPEIGAINHPMAIIVKTMKNEVLLPKAAAIPQPDGSMISMPLEDMTPLLPVEELEENMLFGVENTSYLVRGIERSLK